MLREVDWEREKNLIGYLLEQIDTIELYVKDYDDESFLADAKTCDAVLTRLIVIGEYVAKVSEVIKSSYPEIDWRSIKAARNYYAHVYRGIDWILVWNVVVLELPNLKTKFESIIDTLERDQNGKTN